MSAESTGIHPSHKIEDLIGELQQRKVNRKLHELGDEGVAFLLEAAAIRAEDEQAQQAARDLRRHIANGGSPKDFLVQFPQHQGVDFGNLHIDEKLIDATTSSSLLPALSSPQPETVRGERELEQVSKSKQLVLTEASGLRAEALFKEYPSLEGFFSDDTSWVEDGGDELVARANIQRLLAKKNGKKITEKHKEVVMSNMWGRWKEVEPGQTGRRVDRRGLSIFLTQEEAVNFLWYIHKSTRDAGSPFRNYTISSEPTSFAQDSKKK